MDKSRECHSTPFYSLGIFPFRKKIFIPSGLEHDNRRHFDFSHEIIVAGVNKELLKSILSIIEAFWRSGINVEDYIAFFCSIFAKDNFFLAGRTPLILKI
jgi:hypothetical protein